MDPRAEKTAKPWLLTFRAHWWNNCWPSEPRKPKNTKGDRRKLNDTRPKTSKPGSKSAAPGFEGSKPDPESAPWLGLATQTPTPENAPGATWT